MTALALVVLLAAPDREALAREYFTADAQRRGAILAELDGHDELTPEEAETWRAVVRKLAAKGPKLRKRGTQYFYDKKTKRGKYIVAGSSGKGGLIIGLHGGGEGAGDAGGAAGTFGGIASKFKCVGIFPEVLEKTERGWTTSGTEEFVFELIEAAKRTWPKIPHDRVYIVGHSMGGFGSWTLGAHQADVFAGVGPYAGAPVPYTEDGSKRGKVVGIEDGVIPNLRNVALHVYQSLDDVQVPPEPNVFANREVLRHREEFGGYENYQYVEVDGRGHGAPPGGHVKGFEFLYQFARDPRPKKIVWQPVLSYKRMFYWLWWERPEPRVIVEVEIKAPNVIDVSLGGGSRDGFSLLLDDRLVDLSKDVTVTDGSTVLFRGKAKHTLGTLLRTAGEKYDRQMVFSARIALSE